MSRLRDDIVFIRKHRPTIENRIKLIRGLDNQSIAFEIAAELLRELDEAPARAEVEPAEGHEHQHPVTGAGASSTTECSPVPYDADTCPECGEWDLAGSGHEIEETPGRIIAPLYCPECSMRIFGGKPDFCPHCGEEL